MQPDDAASRGPLARSEVMLAATLDPSVPADQAHRAGLLAHAAGLLGDLEASGSLTPELRLAQARLAALHGAR